MAGPTRTSTSRTANSDTLSPLNAVMAQVVASNPDLQERVRAIMNAILTDVEHTLRWGDPRDRAALQKALMPSMLRAMSGGEEAHDDMKDAYERMMKEMRGG